MMKISQKLLYGAGVSALALSVMLAQVGAANAQTTTEAATRGDDKNCS
ncbi:MAG: hypothetical protein WBQ60_08815 [Asticcacaulis sp.]